MEKEKGCVNKGQTAAKGTDSLWGTGPIDLAVAIIAICFSLFHIYTGFTGIMTEFVQRSVHLCFAMVLAFILFRGSKNAPKRKIPFYDYGFILLSIVTMGYIAWNSETLLFRTPWMDDVSTAQIILGVVTVLLVLEITRRTVGFPMVILALVMLTYNFIGPYLPKGLAHSGMEFERVVEAMYLTTEGIFGVAITVSSTFIILFTIFGSLLNTTGATEYFMDLSKSVAGHRVGGPAKVSVVGSAFMGTISGSAVANVATTGAITIPLMKRLGYRPAFAGAVECASSIGGQIMPPVMGAAAFLIAGITGINYIAICKHALLPSLLYYLGIYLIIHFHSLKIELPFISKSDLPPFFATLLRGVYFLIPIIVLIITLLLGYTAVRAAIAAIVATIATNIFKKETRHRLVRNTLEGLKLGAITVVPIVAACAACGIIIATTRLTGLGIKFGALVINASQGHLPLALFLSAVSAIFLGFGLPTTATYIVMAALVAPGLIQLGVSQIAAHLFVFYYAIIACGTPPVAVAAYAAAGLAESSPTETGFRAVKLQFVAYIIPILFVYNQGLLLEGDIRSVIISITTAVLGSVAFAIAIEGYFKTKLSPVQRLFFTGGGVLILMPGITKAAGLVLLAVLGFFQIKRSRKETEHGIAISERKAASTPSGRG